MPYDQKLADRVREALAGRDGLAEIKMFGGLCFTLRGHMCCGIVGRELVARVGPKGYEAALARPHARPMDFTGREIEGFVFVGPAGLRSGRSLRAWVQRAVSFVGSLPAKGRKAKRGAQRREGQRRGRPLARSSPGDGGA